MKDFANKSFQAEGLSSGLELRIFLAFSLFLFYFAAQFGHAQAAISTPNITYNCTSVVYESAGHCYAIAEWNPAPAFYTQIFTNRIYGGDGHISDEMWDVDANGKWVEAGDASSSVDIPSGTGSYNHGSTAEFLFWADSRPNSNFVFHAGPNLASADFGKYMFVEIARSSSSTFDISIGNLPSAYLYGTSTGNSMANGDEQIGSELYGQSGATNPTNGYAANEWYNPNGTGSWNYQTATPTLTGLPEYPEYGTWAANSTGGILRTCLTGAGC